MGFAVPFYLSLRAPDVTAQRVWQSREVYSLRLVTSMRW